MDLERELLSAERRLSSISRTCIDESLKVTVEIDNLSYIVGPKDYRKTILQDVNVRFDPGNLVCLMGPSGSGKTTLL